MLDADYYPPAGKGDVYRIIASGVKTIVLIDGVFHNAPSVWQRELLDAMDEGIRVVGAASMGALRAAELHLFGMIGRGTIFEWYRDGIIEGDDEVALLHEPGEFNFRALSEPLVNIRFTLQRAIEDGCIQQGQANELMALAGRLYYPDRSYRRLLEMALENDWPVTVVKKLRQYFSTKAVDLKMRDTLDALRHCADFRATRVRRPPRSNAAERTAELDHIQGCMTGAVGSRIVTGNEILEAASKDRALIAKMRTALGKRCFFLDWARQNKVFCPTKFIIEFVKHWRKQYRIVRQRAWLRSNGLTRVSFLRLLTENALAEWLTKKGPPYFALDCGFIAAWARENGVALPRRSLSRPRKRATIGLEEWIVQQGPCHFGLDWSFERSFLAELQLTGKAADIVAMLNAK